VMRSVRLSHTEIAQLLPVMLWVARIAILSMQQQGIETGVVYRQSLILCSQNSFRSKATCGVVTVRMLSIRRMVERITIQTVSHVTTFLEETTDYGIAIRFTVGIAKITMSMSVTIAEIPTGTATDTIAQVMMRMRIAVRYTVIRIDQAHSSLVRVNTISALS